MNIRTLNQFIAIASITLLPLFAQDSDWKIVFSDNTITIKVQKSSITPTKRGAIAWFELKPAKPQSFPGCEAPVVIIKKKSEFSKTGEWVKRMVLQDKNGDVLRDIPFNEPGEFSEFIPNSDVSDAALNSLKLLKQKSASKTQNINK